jgi:hypothetical protein
VIKLNLIKPSSPSPCSRFAAHLQAMGAQSCTLVVHFVILLRLNLVPWWRYCLYFLCTFCLVSDFAASWTLWFLESHLVDLLSLPSWSSLTWEVCLFVCFFFSLAALSIVEKLSSDFSWLCGWICGGNFPWLVVLKN